MTVSIVMPVYNAEENLPICLNSIMRAVDFAACGGQVEVLLVDDGSTDGSAKICDEYASRHSYLRVMHLPNGGVARARNVALGNICGDYVGWIDADDWIDERYFAVVLAELKGGPDVLAFDYCEIPGRRISYGRDVGDLDPAIFCHDLVRDERQRSFLWNKVFRRELFASVRFDESLDQLSDYAVMPRIALAARAVRYVPAWLYNYRICNGSITNQFNAARLRARFVIASSRLDAVSPTYRADALSCVMYHAFWICRQLTKRRVDDREARSVYRRCRAFVRRNLVRGLMDGQNGLRRKMQFVVCAIGFLPWLRRPFF